MYSNSLTYPSLSDMLLLQCPQLGRTPLDVAEENSKEEAAEVLRRHGAKRGEELEEESEEEESEEEEEEAQEEEEEAQEEEEHSIESNASLT